LDLAVRDSRPELSSQRHWTLRASQEGRVFRAQWHVVPIRSVGHSEGRYIRSRFGCLSADLSNLIRETLIAKHRLESMM
jgi:hypothetical protein